jgi:hypothetical protein
MFFAGLSGRPSTKESIATEEEYRKLFKSDLRNFLRRSAKIFPMMFFVESKGHRRRPPTEKMLHARGLIDRCENYIFFSTDPTPEYLAEALKWIDGIGPTLRETDGNSTSSSDSFLHAAEFHAVVGNAIRWLQANRALSRDEIKAQYPTLVADFLTEIEEDRGQMYRVHDNPVSWAHIECDRPFPNLLSSVIHRDRLGEIIDEVLGLRWSFKSARRTKRGSARPHDITRFEQQS